MKKTLTWEPFCELCVSQLHQKFLLFWCHRSQRHFCFLKVIILAVNAETLTQHMKRRTMHLSVAMVTAASCFCWRVARPSHSLPSFIPCLYPLPWLGCPPQWNLIRSDTVVKCQWWRVGGTAKNTTTQDVSPTIHIGLYSSKLFKKD